MRSQIKKGDIVVHPAHGASEVVAIERKEFSGQRRKFLVLKPIMLDMTVYIPQENADHAGLRSPVKREHFGEVVRVLKQKETKISDNWQRRFRTYNRKIQSGDLCQVAEVVRNLDRKNRKKGLSTTENILLERAFTILTSEYVCVKNVDKEDAYAFFSKALSG
ncbi:MAG: CarD family transcriptional regulator [Candidatus Hydrogenedentota bacterium]|nr:MAG: CarD family transcriptional regulator [Candidatus Hydrogenedentota bacterium]